VQTLAGTTFRQLKKPPSAALHTLAAAKATEAAGCKTGSLHRRQRSTLRRNLCGTLARASVQDAEQAQQSKQRSSSLSEQPDPEQLSAAGQPEQQSASKQHAKQPWRHSVSTAYSWVKRQLRIQPSRRHDADIAAIAGPALLSLAADPLLSLVDTAFVGRLGPAELVSLPGDEWALLHVVMQQESDAVYVS
jgi:hypothetical protein